ncbi:MAG: NfeD family protein [Planctomycetota bacterium]
MTDPTLLYWGLGLLAAGVLMAVIELFVPSGGLIALAAGVLAVAGVVVLFRHDTTWGLIGLLAVLVLGPMAFAYGLKVYPHTPVGRRMIMGENGRNVAVEQVDRENKAKEHLLALVGEEGEAISALRPVGTVKIGDERFEALAEGLLIEAGARVRVTRVDSGQIKVRPIA